MLFDADGWIFVKLVRYSYGVALITNRPARMVSKYQLPTPHTLMFSIKMEATGHAETAIGDSMNTQALWRSS
ncbi:MAG: hypothetical protein CMD92_04110 [Gammaproteobacteria bacterium]|nr:hypothetical protein [Gammaproteobacteria bacterium]|tara:strand:- start:1105 stop:1320 length:216 start_codon:yes stop_codon:yes gene_type:complete